MKFLIFDFDTAIGQVNSTMPYKFPKEGFEIEIQNTLDILDTLVKKQIKAVFAICGFAAEKSISPFDQRELIKEISTRGHEIASHSLKHENFSRLNKNQVLASLTRSKESLELLLNSKIQKEIADFVPPHNRPMSWFRKGRIHPSDQPIFSRNGVKDIGDLIDCLNQVGYKWLRISGHILKKVFLSSLNNEHYHHKLYNVLGINILDGHHCGFNLTNNNDLVTISAHTLMWSRFEKVESKNA